MVKRIDDEVGGGEGSAARCRERGAAGEREEGEAAGEGEGSSDNKRGRGTVVVAAGMEEGSRWRRRRDGCRRGKQQQRKEAGKSTTSE